MFSGNRFVKRLLVSGQNLKRFRAGGSNSGRHIILPSFFDVFHDSKIFEIHSFSLESTVSIAAKFTF